MKLNNIITSALINYLKKENIFDLFWYNCGKQKRDKELIKTMQNDSVPQGQNLFIHAFIWINTKEGHYFWYKHHLRFQKVFRKQYLQKYLIINHIKQKKYLL